MSGTAGRLAGGQEAEKPSPLLGDLANRQMDAYTEPSVTTEQADYRRVRTHQSQDDVIPVLIGDHQAGRLVLNNLLP